MTTKDDRPCHVKLEFGRVSVVKGQDEAGITNRRALILIIILLLCFASAFASFPRIWLHLKATTISSTTTDDEVAYCCLVPSSSLPVGGPHVNEWMDKWMELWRVVIVFIIIPYMHRLSCTCGSNKGWRSGTRLSSRGHVMCVGRRLSDDCVKCQRAISNKQWKQELLVNMGRGGETCVAAIRFPHIDKDMGWS